MDKVVNFPNNNQEDSQETVGNRISQQNAIYLDGIKDRMKFELEAIARTGNAQATDIGKVIYNIVYGIIDQVNETFEHSPEMRTRVSAPQFINQCMQSVNAIFSGGIISPLTGDENEWHDTTIPEDVGQKFQFKYRGKEYEIPIESVQINLRYPKIYRLNNDNRYAHRIDFVQFHDAMNPDRVHLTEDSIRFIQFPYTMQSVHSSCIVNDRTITDYLDYDYNEIANGLIYPDQNSDDPNSYVIAPKIPFFMLEEEGISVEDEIATYLQSIEDLNSFGIDDDDDDEYEDFNTTPSLEEV